jgi:hypothetical protein
LIYVELILPALPLEKDERLEPSNMSTFELFDKVGFDLFLLMLLEFLEFERL